jgi:hypothetical protein
VKMNHYSKSELSTAMSNYLQVCSKNSNVVYHKHHILNRPNMIGKMYRDILTVTMNIFSSPIVASFVTYVFTTSNEKHQTMKDYSENFIPMSQE